MHKQGIPIPIVEDHICYLLVKLNMHVQLRYRALCLVAAYIQAYFAIKGNEKSNKKSQKIDVLLVMFYYHNNITK